MGRKLLLFLITGVFVVGCNYTKIKDPSKDNQRFNLPASEKLQLSYSYVVRKVFAANCITCHGTSGGVNLETFASIKNNIEAIKDSVFVSKSMPKRGALTDEEMSILWSWIDMGSPEIPQSGIDEPLPSPIAPTFESLDTHIFQVTCIKCHIAGKSGERVPLGKVDLLNSPLELVLPGNADESGLVIFLEREDEKRMPPPKEGYSRLKDEQIKAVRDWINNGAKD